MECEKYNFSCGEVYVAITFLDYPLLKGMEHVPNISMSFDKVFVFRSDKHPHFDWSI